MHLGSFLKVKVQNGDIFGGYEIIFFRCLKFLIFLGVSGRCKDKYMAPAHSLKNTRSSHSAQYRRRHQTYSDALKNSFSPRTIPHWNSLSPSVANTQSTEKFRALLV